MCRPTIHEIALTSTAYTAAKPRSLAEVVLDRRTREWRRCVELVGNFTRALGGQDAIDEVMAAKINSAAEMRVIAELARARYLGGEGVTLNDVVRAERAAGLAEKALQIGVKHGRRRRSAAEIFANRGDAAA